jgi:hypothetical protein
MSGHCLSIIRTIVTGVLFLSFCNSWGALCNSKEIPSLDSRWQLFLDDFIVDRGTGFDRVVHRPRAMGVVISNDKPWESTGVAPGFFMRRDDGTFVAFYTAIWWAPDRENKSQPDRAQQYVTASAYATSKDGIHWDKPNLGLMEAPAGIDWEKMPPFPSPKGMSKENNLGVPFGIRDMGEFGNVTEPEKRYAISYNGKGYFARDIPDFLHDANWTNKLVSCGGTFSPRGKALDYWDDLNQEWVGIVQNAVPHWLPTREIARFASKDLGKWTSDIVLTPDPADPHLVNYYDEPMSLSPFCAEGVVVGLLSWFHSDRTNPDGGPVLQKTSEYPFIWPWARKGANEMRITISRDGGLTWDRTSSRVAWIPHGTEEDSYDRLVISPSLPLRVGEEDWYYMGVFDGDHLSTRSHVKQNSYYSDRLRKGQIALYIQKRNRYVSLRAPDQREVATKPELRPAAGWLSASNPKPVLITKPLTVSGKTLQLNVEANRGMVRVAIASADPIETLNGSTLSTAPHLAELHPLKGFSFDDCEPIHANHIEHTVKFKDGLTLEGLRGRQVRLLFEMVDADLYGFRAL